MASTEIETIDDTDAVDGIDCSPCLGKERVQRALVTIGLGQLMALTLSGTAVSSEYLASHFQVNTPTTQSFLNYLMLGLVYGTIISCKEPSELSLIGVVRDRGWKYVIVALFDVEANFLIVLAFQYSNLTSIQVLNCFTIPVVLLLSWLCMHVRYLITHIIGVAVVLLGIAALIWADAIDQKATNPAEGSNRLLGDMLALGGATLYGLCNVCEEYFVKSYTRVEFLGMIGLFGSIISGLQLAVLERTALSQVNWADGRIILLYLAFALCMFCFYSLVTVMMQRSSAAFFNLVVRTSDFYSLTFGIVLFKYNFHIVYFLSFACVLIGSMIYSAKDTHRTDDESDENDRLQTVRQCDGSVLVLDTAPTSRAPDCICCTGMDCCDGDDDEDHTLGEQYMPVTRPYYNNQSTTQPNGTLPNTNVNNQGKPAAHYCPVHGQRTEPNVSGQSNQTQGLYQNPRSPSLKSSTRTPPAPPPRANSSLASVSFRDHPDQVQVQFAPSYRQPMIERRN